MIKQLYSYIYISVIHFTANPKQTNCFTVRASPESVAHKYPAKKLKKCGTERYDKTNSHIFTTATHSRTHTYANTHAQPHTDMTHVTDAHTYTETHMHR